MLPKHLLVLNLILVSIIGCSEVDSDTETETQKSVAENSETDEQTSEAEEKTPETPTQKYSDGAIRQAALDGLIDIVRQGIADGNDTNAKDANGMNALHMAAFNGHHEIVKILLKNGAKVDERDGTGKSALIHAASGPFPATVDLLLDSGADVNLVDSTEEFTALMMAAAEGQLEVVKRLIKRGADPSMVDTDGDGAMKFAMQKRHVEVIQFLASLQNESANGDATSEPAAE